MTKGIQTSWSTWGLQTLDDRASDRTVLSGGGRLLSLGIDEHLATEAERFSDRWSVSLVELVATSPRPRRGDIVIWRGLDREDPMQWFIWGSPTRVLSVSDGDRSGVVEVCTLDDAALDDRCTDGDAEWLEEAVSADAVIAARDEWAVLANWRLYPACPRCGAAVRSYVYGMPTSDLAERNDLVIGGCVLGTDMPAYQCIGCGHEF